MITHRNFNLVKTRQEWLSLLTKIDPSPFLKDTSASFISQLNQSISHLDVNWIVFGEFRSDLGASPLIYIDESGALIPLGCKHCLAGNRTYENGVLTIAAKKAIPLSKKSTQFDDFAFILDKILFFCPYCNRLIKDYAGDFIQ
jgi:hypothetical protein